MCVKLQCVQCTAIIEIRVTSGARNLLEIGRRDKSAGGCSARRKMPASNDSDVVRKWPNLSGEKRDRFVVTLPYTRNYDRICRRNRDHCYLSVHRPYQLVFSLYLPLSVPPWFPLRSPCQFFPQSPPLFPYIHFHLRSISFYGLSRFFPLILAIFPPTPLLLYRILLYGSTTTTIGAPPFAVFLLSPAPPSIVTRVLTAISFSASQH